MGLTSNLVIIMAAHAIFLIQCTFAKCNDQVENEEEFNYQTGGKLGPEHWGELHKDWAACGEGHMQSPIDISDSRVKLLPSLGQLSHTYQPAAAVLKNRGHDIMLQWEGGAGGVLINGTEYSLKQLHWHTPSEHTINGHRYSLEMHMVHESAAGKVAVVGVLYTIGQPEPFLKELEGYIQKIRDIEGAEEKVGIVNPSNVRGSKEYYRYMGSLTTPPCTEGVVWTILGKVKTVSSEQVGLLKVAVHDGFEINARPIQVIHDRVIGLYRPTTL